MRALRGIPRRSTVGVLLASAGLTAGAMAWSAPAPTAPPKRHREMPPKAAVFISPTGSDANPCSQAAPCASFSRGYQVARPGDVVCVAAGTYGKQSTPFVSGRSMPAVVFQSCESTATVLGIEIGSGNGGSQPCCVTFKDLAITGSTSDRAVFVYWGNADPLSSAHDITFDHDSIGVGQPTSGPVFEAYDTLRLTVKNSTIGPACCGTDANGSPAGSPVGIRLAIANTGYPPTTNAAIDHNLIQGITRSCSYWLEGYGACPQAPCTNESTCHADGIQIWGAANTTITRNRIYNNEVQAIFFDPTAPLNGGTIANNMIGGVINGACGICWDGRGTVGAWTVAFNSLQGIAHIRVVNVSRLAPGTTFAIRGNAGNMVTEAGTSGSDCFSGASGVFTYTSNVWAGAGSSSTSCGASDRKASPAFVNSNVAPSATMDLHLARGSAAIDRGDPTVHPALDIDSDMRPLRTSPDAGADQRETALLIPGKSLGALRIGEKKSEVEAFYGSPRRHVRWKPKGAKRHPPSGGVAPMISFYRVHGGSLWAIYQGDTVVGIGTTSRFYSTASGLGAGALASTIRGSHWRDCPHAFRTFSGGVATFYGAPSKMTTATITSVSMLRRAYEYC